MTAFDRFETRLPELMTELAQPATPDYVTDMLRQTARTRQRPAWSAPERWLPMGVLARTLLPVRFLPWRSIAIAGLLLLLAAAALAFYIGTRHTLPAPFGPARNGLLLTSAANGDIVSFDPATGTSRPVLASGGAAVTFSSTGQTFFYDKSATGAPEMWVANADGINGHKVWSGPADTTWVDWSQDGKRLVIAEHPTAGTTTVHLVDARTVVDQAVIFDKRFTSVAQPYGGHTLLLVEEGEGQPTVFYLANEDGTGLRKVETIAASGFMPALSPDGTRLAYASWQDGFGLQGRIHVLTLATGVDIAVTPDTGDGMTWVSPIFSPDGTHLAVQRFRQGTQGFDLSLVAVDPAQPTVGFGTEHVADNDPSVAFSFSPDGKQIIARYGDDSTAWLFDVTGGPGQQVSGITTPYFSWQRAGE